MSIQEKTYISKRSGKTVTQYCAVVYDSENKKYIWSKRCDTKKEARQYERELIESLEQNTRVDKKKLFNSLANDWLIIASKQYANSTYRGYLWYTNQYILPVFSGQKISSITPVHIQKFVTAMSDTYSPETVNKTINILSNIFKFGIDLNITNTNPCERIKRVRVSNRKHTIWTDDQIMYFLSLPETKSSIYYDMFVLSFTLGIRPSELCGISETDFMNNGILCLNRGFDRYGVISNMKNQSSHRPLELSDALVKLLNRRITFKKKQKLAMGSSSHYKENDFLFTNSKGNPVNPNSYARAFRNVLRSHNEKVKSYEESFGFIPPYCQLLPEIRLYDARHSFATNNILSNSASIKIVSEILGHSTVKTTLHNYTQVTQSMSKTTIDNYSKKLLGSVSF